MTKTQFNFSSLRSEIVHFWVGFDLCLCLLAVIPPQPFPHLPTWLPSPNILLRAAKKQQQFISLMMVLFSSKNGDEACEGVTFPSCSSQRKRICFSFSAEFFPSPRIAWREFNFLPNKQSTLQIDFWFFNFFCLGNSTISAFKNWLWNLMTAPKLFDRQVSQNNLFSTSSLGQTGKAETETAAFLSL